MTPQAEISSRRSWSAALVLPVLLIGLLQTSAAEDLAPGLPSIPSDVRTNIHEEKAPVPDGRLALRLVWCDILKGTRFPFEEMTAEVERILGAWDVHVSWRVGGEDARYQPGEIPVILLDRSRVDSQASGHVMGSTPRRSEVRAAWVFSSSVVWALGVKGRSPLSSDQEHELARAMGRVVAHEIVHVVAPDVPHAGRGLMKPSMGRHDLLRPGLTLENQHRRAFVAGLGTFVAAETADPSRALSSGDPERLADGGREKP